MTRVIKTRGQSPLHATIRPLGEISRGDLLVFRNPHASDEVLIKRVLALPGETLKVEAGRLLVDGLHRPEPYVKPGTALLRLAAGRCPRR